MNRADWNGRAQLEHSCGAVVTASAKNTAGWTEAVKCNSCGESQELKLERLTDAGGLRGCLACGHEELYRKKVFPPALGVGIVVVAALFAPFTYYISLGVAAVLDLVLFAFMPEANVCYVCNAHHRDFNPEPKHPKFDREIEERLLYGDKAVMGKPMREGGTAGAPEPEH